MPFPPFPENEMTNQAAQTMPELPKSFGEHCVYDSVRVMREPGYTAAQMHQYARDYAAALSQTAGVADVVWRIENEASQFVNSDGMVYLNYLKDLLAAAPAASGGEDDLDRAARRMGDSARALLRDIAEQQAAAPVSERARAIFSAMLSAPYGDTTMGDIVCAETTRNRLESAWLPILEQALTQQRGHGEAVDRDAWAEALELPEGYTVEEFLPGGWHYAWTRADGERMVSGTTWNHPALAAIAAWQCAPATTPQPSADAVRELVRRWREKAKRTDAEDRADDAYENCADELESLLSGGSHA